MSAMQDAYQSPLTFSGGVRDTMLLTLLEAVYTGGQDHFVASIEQGIPVQPSWLNFNRLRLRAERSLPLLSRLSAHLCMRGTTPRLQAGCIGAVRSHYRDSVCSAVALVGCFACCV